MDPTPYDAQLRQAAFDHVKRLDTLRGGVLDSADLAVGFEFRGERIPLINPQRGIFKPRQMGWNGAADPRPRPARGSFSLLPKKISGLSS